jgi:hypothetical protein
VGVKSSPYSPARWCRHDHVRKSAPFAPIASWARKGFGPTSLRTSLSTFQYGMFVARWYRSPASVMPQKSTSRMNDQWSPTVSGIIPSAHMSFVIADGSGSTISHTLLISWGKAGCAIPTPSSELGKPEVTERISMSG